MAEMNKDLEKLFVQINKTYGEGTIQMLTEQFVPQIKTYKTGSLVFDLALGTGIANGRIIEVFGPSMAGKTTVAYLHIAEVQRANEGFCAFIDAEHAFNAKLAKEYGVNLDRLVYINPKTAENAIDTTEALIRTNLFRLIVIDSVPALVPTAVMDNSIEKQTMAILARFMSVAMQKLNGIAYQYECSVLFINQLREKVGGYAPNGITPEITPGGRALPFYSSQRIRVQMGDKIKVKDEIVGHFIKIKVIKNKVAVPFKEATFPLIYGKGIDLIYEVVELAVLAGIITQGGAWFKYADESGDTITRNGVVYKWQGKANLTEFVRQTPAFFAELEEILRGVEVKIQQGEPEGDEDGYSGLEAPVVTPEVEA